MKLFTFATSPYARKVRMVLEYKGLECEMVERCYSLDRKPDLREASERAEVPVLVLDDGRAIADSTVICEYLEDAHPNPPVFPSDPFERARMRAIDDLCDRTFDATVFGYFLGVVRSSASEAEAMKDAGRAEFKALLARLERELDGRDFFCGAALSLADLSAICHVPVAHAMRLQMNEFPRLAAWEQRMRAIPLVAADLERARKAMAGDDLASEFEGPDGRVHWRDSRLEWPMRHGFVDFIAREFHAGKMMFPPDAS
jgi:glutathione S-transferase